MHVPSPSIIPGRLHKDNKGAIDWGWQNLVAYGCHSYVVVIDPVNLGIVQTLDEHLSAVCCVKWSHEPIRYDIENSNVLKLASGDNGGNIIVWNVQEASVLATLTDKAVVDFKWHPEDSSLIAALHAPNSLILWNVTNGTRLWKKDVSDHSVVNFIFDPFEPLRVTLATNQGFIYAISDFSKTTTPPAQVDFKYRINSRTTVSKDKNSKQTCDFVQMMFSPHMRNVLYILLSREILIFDTTTNQSIGSVMLDRNRGNFSQMVMCRENTDLLFCLHDDGSLSAWNRRSDPANSHNYELTYFSDLSLINKKSKKKNAPLWGIVNSPLFEYTLATVGGDGTFWTWNYVTPRLVVTGQLEQLTSTVTSLMVSPFDPSNVALGTALGTILLINANTKVVVREVVVWTQPVHGIKWLSPTRLVGFSTEELADKGGLFKNAICWVDIQTGRVKEFRRVSSPEPSFIRGIRVSPLRQYLIILLKDRPFELWELHTFTLVRTFKPFAQVVALEWALPPVEYPEASPLSLKEQFVFTSATDGSVRFFTVEPGGTNNVVITATELSVDLGAGNVSSLAWKGDYLVSGDTAGTIHCWNMEKKKLQTYATHRGLIKRLRFSPTITTSNVPLLVLFAGGDFGIWDLAHGIRVSVSSYLTTRELKASEVDWLSDGVPIISTNDGCIRMLDKSLSICNSKLALSNVGPLCSPYLLPSNSALLLKVVLQNLGTHISDEPTTNVTSLLSLLDQSALSAFKSGTIAQRCLLIAQYFGDNFEVQFWTLALYAFHHYNSIAALNFRTSAFNSTSNSTVPSRQPSPTFSSSSVAPTTSASAITSPLASIISPPIAAAKKLPRFSSLPRFPDSPFATPFTSPPASPTMRSRATHHAELRRSSLVTSSSGTALGQSVEFESSEDSGLAQSYLGGDDALDDEISSILEPPHEQSIPGQLPAYFDVLLDKTSLRSIEEERADVHAKKKLDADLSKKLVDKNILLGRSHKAIDLLLETPAESPDFVANSLKACVFAASTSPETFSHTVKLVATYFIANNRLDDGIELLCLIGKGLDACRYLQSYDRWVDAAMLAKTLLPEAECAVVMRRWAQHLVKSKQNHKAIQILLTLGEFQSVLQLLLEIQCPDVAALFAAACISQNMLGSTDDGDLMGHDGMTGMEASLGPQLTAQLETIHVEFGNYISKLGWQQGATYYWQKGGKAGAAILENIVTK